MLCVLALVVSLDRYSFEFHHGEGSAEGLDVLQPVAVVWWRCCVSVCSAGF